MFPIRDHNPSLRTPFVTYALILANVAIFLSYLPVLGDQGAAARFFQEWGLVPAFALDAPERVVTSMFLHGGLMHLAGNMLFLYIFGDNLEDAMGHVAFLGFYIAGGLGAALAQIASAPASTMPMVGASGAIGAVMGGYLLLFPRARVDVLVIIVFIVRIVPVPAWLMLGLWFGFQILAGAATPTTAGGVAYWAHVGGFATGLALAVPVWARRGAVRFWDRTNGRPPHPEARVVRSRSRIPKAGHRR